MSGCNFLRADGVCWGELLPALASLRAVQASPRTMNAADAPPPCGALLSRLALTSAELVPAIEAEPCQLSRPMALPELDTPKSSNRGVMGGPRHRALRAFA